MKIAANKKAFSEEKQENRVSNGGSKATGSDDSHNYNQNKWVAPENGIGIRLFENKLMCWFGKKNCGCNTTLTTNFHGSNKQNPTTFCLPETHPYIKSLHKLNGIPLDMTPTSLISGAYQTVSNITSTGSTSGTTNDVLYIKHSVAITGLNKLVTQVMNPDIAKLASVFCIIFNLN